MFGRSCVVRLDDVDCISLSLFSAYYLFTSLFENLAAFDGDWIFHFYFWWWNVVAALIIYVLIPSLSNPEYPGFIFAHDTCCENEVVHGIDGVVVSCSSLRGPSILDSLSSAPALAHLVSSARSRQDVIQFEANANGGRRPVLLWETNFWLGPTETLFSNLLDILNFIWTGFKPESSSHNSSRSYWWYIKASTVWQIGWPVLVGNVPDVPPNVAIWSDINRSFYRDLAEIQSTPRQCIILLNSRKSCSTFLSFSTETLKGLTSDRLPTWQLLVARFGVQQWKSCGFICRHWAL